MPRYKAVRAANGCQLWGHKGRFRSPGLSASYEFSTETFAVGRGKEEEAPIADLPALTGWFDPMRSFTQRADFGPS